MNVIHLTIWSCCAEGCGHTEEQSRVESVWAAMDPRTVQPRPSLPEGWQDVEGRAYCPCHTVEVQAIVRTPVTREWEVRSRGDLLGWMTTKHQVDEQKVEIVQLRRAA